MELFYVLMVLLISSRIFGEIAGRLKFPVILGEIFAGVILGIVFKLFSGQFPNLSSLPENEVFHAITELSIFFLMLYAGLELHPDDFKKSSGKAIWVAIGGMLVPFGFGMGLMWFAIPEGDSKFQLALFVGVVLAITAVPVAVKLLMDLGKLNSKVGKLVVSSAVIDDIISLIMLSILTAFLSTGTAPGWGEVLKVVGKIIVFFVITGVIGKYLLPKMNEVVFKNALVDEIEVSFLLIIAFLFSVFAELLGMHFIMGAFVAGLFFVQRNLSKKVFQGVTKKVKGITTGFLAPIFFAGIGLNLDISAIPEIPWFILALITLAVLGKLFGTMIPAWFQGYSKKELLTIGFSMNARGVVSIIIADVALKSGLFDKAEGSEIVENLFSAVVIMAIITTLITPIALRSLNQKNNDNSNDQN